MQTGVNPMGSVVTSNPWGVAADRATDSSEFSWGSGLTPAGLGDALPSEGGRYRGMAPDCVEQISVSFDTRG